MTYELYHHGILGMKWGVRRYQNPDGSLTAAGKERYQTDLSGKMTAKGAENWYKDNRNEIINKQVKYEMEYDEKAKNTDTAKEFRKLLDKVETSSELTEEEWSAFGKAEEKYLRAQGEYSAKKLIEEYGQEKADIYANEGRINTGIDAVQAISDDWWVHAY